jgi:beta-N-acetylglucosaminidase
MNKKGMTLKTLLSMILTIMGLVLLIYGLNKFLGFGCASTEKEQASAEAEQLQVFLDSLPLGETDNFMLLVPTKWYLRSFNPKTLGTPTEFFGKNVICICNKEDCKDLYYCKEIKKPALVNNQNLNTKIEIKTLTIINTQDFYGVFEEKYVAYTFSNTQLDENLRTRYPNFVGLGTCIEDASKSTGVPISFIIAVAALESGAGTSALSQGTCSKGPAAYSNNLFGITKGETVGYETCKWPTRECLTESEKAAYVQRGDINSAATSCTYSCEKVGQICANVFREFLAFQDSCDSIKYFVNRIIKSQYYRAAWEKYQQSQKTTVDLQTFIDEVGEKYATDPDWASKVKSYVTQIENEFKIV